MRILKLKKFEVCRFEEEAVEHDDADLCLDKLPEEGFSSSLKSSARVQKQRYEPVFPANALNFVLSAGFRAAPDLDSPKIISTCS